MRQSNIEILRIIAMFLVLVHSDFVNLGYPTLEHFFGNPIKVTGKNEII